MLAHLFHALRSVRSLWKKRPLAAVFIVLISLVSGFLLGAYLQATGGLDILKLFPGQG